MDDAQGIFCGDSWLLIIVRELDDETLAKLRVEKNCITC